MFFGRKRDVDELRAAIDVLKRDNTEKSRKHMFNVFRKYVEDRRWLFTVGEKLEKGMSGFLVEEQGRVYIPIYTEPDELKSQNGRVIQTDINKFLDSLYESEQVSGLVINPGSQNLYMEKEYIAKILIHDKYPKQNNSGSPKKDWGIGIPVYGKQDLMTKGQFLNLAMQVVHDYELKNSDLIPVSYCDNTEAEINYIMKERNKLVFIVVHPYIMFEEPEIEDGEKLKIKQICKRFNADCLIAMVGVCSCDAERSAKRLLLKGDGFYINYTGMEGIS